MNQLRDNHDERTRVGEQFPVEIKVKWHLFYFDLVIICSGRSSWLLFSTGNLLNFYYSVQWGALSVLPTTEYYSSSIFVRIQRDSNLLPKQII